MLTDFFAIKTGMTQAWTKDGRRLAVTKLQASDNLVVADLGQQRIEIGYGLKNSKNINKPQRARYQKGDFSFMPAKLTVGKLTDETVSPKAGDAIKVDKVLSVGDLVEIQGKTKGRGFAGAVKRYGFHGGPKTHGQSDRNRAVGSIGSGTTPGRVYKGKRMPGHYGVDTQTVKGLVVLYINNETHEVWVSGPVPGHIKSFVRIHKTGENKEINLDKVASGIQESASLVNQLEESPTQAETTPVVQPEAEKIEEVEITEEIAEIKEPKKTETVKEVEEAK